MEVWGQALSFHLCAFGDRSWSHDKAPCRTLARGTDPGREPLGMTLEAARPEPPSRGLGAGETATPWPFPPATPSSPAPVWAAAEQG